MGWEYTYCPKCERGAPESTMVEVLKREYCCKNCGYQLNTGKSAAEVIIELAERVERIEKHLGLPPL